MRVEVFGTHKGISKKWIAQWCEGALKLTPKKIQRTFSDKELLVIFVSKARMEKLNSQFRKKNAATDILSFAPIESGTNGELVLSLQVISAQAKFFEWTCKEELGFMLIHGILHLAGYDHEVDVGRARVMMNLQKKIFQKLAKVAFRKQRAREYLITK